MKVAEQIREQIKKIPENLAVDLIFDIILKKKLFKNDKMQKEQINKK